MDHQDLQLCNKKDDERFQISNVKSNLLSPWKGWDCGQKKSKPPTWNVVARPLTITFGERCVKPVLPSLSLSYSCLWNLKHATSTVFAPRIWKAQKQKGLSPPRGTFPPDCYCSPLPCSSQTLTSSFFCIARISSICSCSRGKSWKGRTRTFIQLGSENLPIDPGAFEFRKRVPIWEGYHKGQGS